MTPADLDIGAALSDVVTPAGYKVAPGGKAGEDWPVADFGREDTIADDVWVVMDGVPGSQTRGETAGEAAALVAWLLTNRDELIRLARIGLEVTRG